MDYNYNYCCCSGKVGQIDFSWNQNLGRDGPLQNQCYYFDFYLVDIEVVQLLNWAMPKGGYRRSKMNSKFQLYIEE